MGRVKIVRASAGSGKTFRLVSEYLAALVAEPAAYRHTLAVTFTNKATGEMKERIVRQLHALASGEASPYEEPLRRAGGLPADEVRRRAAVAQGMILHDYSHFAVLTIDKFFQNIIRSFLRELGISPNFSIELRTDTLLEQAADALVELSASDPALEAWIGEFAMEQMEESAGWDVRRKLAKAGGEVFGEEWMRGGTAGRQALGEAVGRATTQCAAAMGKIENLARQAITLIENNGLAVDDFSYKKSGAAGFLERTARGEGEDYAAKNHVVRTLKGEMAWTGKNSPAEARIEAIAPQLNTLLGQIAAIWDSERSLLNTTAILRRRWRSFGLLDDISRQVERLAAEGNVVPIARTNKLLSELIAGNEIPFIFEKAGERFTRFLIDEFQDTSRGQWENFIPLLQNALSQSAGESVLLVGDVKQSIYRWRGGDWQILASGAAGALGEAQLDALEDNRRSLERVVTFNNTLIGQCVAHDTRALDETLLKAEDEGFLSRPKREELLALLPGAYYGHAQNPMPEKQGGYVTVTLRAATGKDGQPEGPDPVILRVEELQKRGFAPADIAILVRRRAEAQAIARLLLDHKAANPRSPYSYDVVTAEALSVGSSETVRFLAACLSLAADPADGGSRAIWARRTGRPFHEPLPDDETAFLRSLGLILPGQALRKVLTRYDIEADASQTAYVQAFEQQLLRYSTDNVADLALFLKWWREEGANEPIYMPESRSAIGIVTVHAAKGLERRAVIVPYCSWSLTPKSDSTLWVDCAETPLAEAGRVAIGYGKAAAQSFFSQEYYTETVLSHVDNINLLYVALTRAREELHVCVPRKKSKTPALPASVGDLLTSVLRIEGEKAAVGDMAGRVTRDDEQLTVAEFGSPVSHDARAGKDDGRIRTGYPTREAGLRIRLRMPSRRYADDGAGSAGLVPRDYGIVMHRVFGNAQTEADLWDALADLRRGGLLSDAEKAHVEALIRRALTDRRIASWFAPGWEVRNENDILIPGENNRRPDRVMTRKGHAVVVDYKFGRRRDAAHRVQIAGYMELLRRMGYGHVEGWLWYVSMSEVVGVDLL